MSVVVGLTLGSGIILAILSYLYHREVSLGRRIIFPEIRARGDEWLEKLYTSIRAHARTNSVLQVKIRYVMHFCIHRLLGWLHAFLEFCDARIIRLQRRNTTVANSIRKEGERSHLEQIVAHKEYLRNGGKSS